MSDHAESEGYRTALVQGILYAVRKRIESYGGTLHSRQIRGAVEVLAERIAEVAALPSPAPEPFEDVGLMSSLAPSAPPEEPRAACEAPKGKARLGYPKHVLRLIDAADEVLTGAGLEIDTALGGEAVEVPADDLRELRTAMRLAAGQCPSCTEGDGRHKEGCWLAAAAEPLLAPPEAPEERGEAKAEHPGHCPHDGCSLDRGHSGECDAEAPFAAWAWRASSRDPWKATTNRRQVERVLAQPGGGGEVVPLFPSLSQALTDRSLRVWTPKEACSARAPFEYDQGDLVLVHYDDLYDTYSDAQKWRNRPDRLPAAPSPAPGEGRERFQKSDRRFQYDDNQAPRPWAVEVVEALNSLPRAIAWCTNEEEADQIAAALNGEAEVARLREAERHLRALADRLERVRDGWHDEADELADLEAARAFLAGPEERCEGCEKPAETSDAEGVPFCTRCATELTARQPAPLAPPPEGEPFRVVRGPRGFGLVAWTGEQVDGQLFTREHIGKRAALLNRLWSARPAPPAPEGEPVAQTEPAFWARYSANPLGEAGEWECGPWPPPPHLVGRCLVLYRRSHAAPPPAAAPPDALREAVGRLLAEVSPIEGGRGSGYHCSGCGKPAGGDCHTEDCPWLAVRGAYAMSEAVLDGAAPGEGAWPEPPAANLTTSEEDEEAAEPGPENGQRPFRVEEIDGDAYHVTAWDDEIVETYEPIDLAAARGLTARLNRLFSANSSALQRAATRIVESCRVSLEDYDEDDATEVPIRELRDLAAALDRKAGQQGGEGLRRRVAVHRERLSLLRHRLRSLLAAVPSERAGMHRTHRGGPLVRLLQAAAGGGGGVAMGTMTKGRG